MHRAKTLATMNSESIGKYTSNSRRARVSTNRHLLVAVMSACRFLGILIKIEVIHHFADLYYTCPGIDIKILLLGWWMPEVVLLEFPANAAMWGSFFSLFFLAWVWLMLSCQSPSVWHVCRRVDRWDGLLATLLGDVYHLGLCSCLAPSFLIAWLFARFLWPLVLSGVNLELVLTRCWWFRFICISYIYIFF